MSPSWTYMMFCVFQCCSPDLRGSDWSEGECVTGYIAWLAAGLFLPDGSLELQWVNHSCIWQIWCHCQYRVWSLGLIAPVEGYCTHCPGSPVSSVYTLSVTCAELLTPGTKMFLCGGFIGADQFFEISATDTFVCGNWWCV